MQLGGVTVKIGDFGLAKAFDRAGLSGLTRTGAVAGTVRYMPRTQVVDYKYAKPEVDVWATAATLYRMLTGTTPRDFPPGTDPIVVLLRESAVPIRDHAPTLNQMVRPSVIGNELGRSTLLTLCSTPAMVR